MATYTYSIADDTLTGTVDPARLATEINATAIVTALDCIMTNGDVLDIVFVDTLSSGDETILTTTVNAHDGTPAPNKARITIYGEVLQAAEQDVQLPRLLDALDDHASVSAALDNKNYQLAYSRVVHAKDEGALLQTDVDLIVSKFPDGWND